MGNVSKKLSSELAKYQEKFSLGLESGADMYCLLQICEKAVRNIQELELKLAETASSGSSDTVSSGS